MARLIVCCLVSAAACDRGGTPSADSATAANPQEMARPLVSLEDSIPTTTDTLAALQALRGIIEENIGQLRKTELRYARTESDPADVVVFSDSAGPRKIMQYLCVSLNETCGLDEFYFVRARVFLASSSNQRRTASGSYVPADTVREEFWFVDDAVRGYMRLDGFIHEGPFERTDEVGNLGANYHDTAVDLYKRAIATIRPTPR
jgi:hypothetical protein